MNTAELITAIRYAAFISNSDPEYTDAQLRLMATRCLRKAFADVIARSRSGYWRQWHFYTLDSETRNYRIPARALSNAVEFVEIEQASAYWKLHPIDMRDAGPMQNLSGNLCWYQLANDSIVLTPKPSGAGTMRVTYAVRPSALVPIQDSGLITAVDRATKTATVNSIPASNATALPIDTGDSVDVVHASGGYELGLVGVTCTIAGSDITFDTDEAIDRVQVGDYVRAANETDWPMLPEEFHSTLADAVAAEVLLQKGAAQKAQQLSAKVSSELGRLADLIQPRAKWDPWTMRRRNSLLTYNGPFSRGPWGGVVP